MIPVRLLLRTVLVVSAAVLTAVLGARGYAPLPDLVLLLVVAVGLRSGTLGGAIVGLLAGWVVDLVPPGSNLLGAAALTYAAAGLLAGWAHREGVPPRGWFVLVTGAAALLLEAVRGFVALGADAPVDLGGAALRWLLTVLVGALVVPLLIGAEHHLARRGWA